MTLKITSIYKQNMIYPYCILSNSSWSPVIIHSVYKEVGIYKDKHKYCEYN